MQSRSNLIIWVGAIILALSFFLDWGAASSGGETGEAFSGLDLASDEGFGNEDGDKRTDVWLVLVGAIVAFAAPFLATSGKITRQVSNIIAIVAALVALFIFYTNWSDIKDLVEPFGASLDMKIGFWGTVLGLIGVGGGAIYGFVEKGTATSTPAATPPSASI